jgi:DNA-binding beta-propeller fold protein YncE
MIGRTSTYLIVLLAFNLTACQSFVEVVTQAGDNGLVWPLPPTLARLQYDEQIDINQSMSAYVGLATGTKNIQLIIPYRVSAAMNLMAIVDYERGSAYVIDRFRNSVNILKNNNGSQLVAVKDIAIDDMRRVYLIDSLKGQIAIFQDNGKLIRQFGSALLWTNPNRLAVDVIQQRVYVADSFQGRVYVFSLSGVFLYMFGEQGNRDSDRGRFSDLTDLEVDADGNLYILESTTKRIQKFDSHGAWLQTIKLDKQYFREPVAIEVENNEAIYIADRGLSQINVLDKTGQMILSIGGLGRNRGKFVDLTDISFDQYRQRLFTAETSTSRVQVFRRTPSEWFPYP